MAISPLKSGSNGNLEMLVFEERGKPEYPEKNLTYIEKNKKKQNINNGRSVIHWHSTLCRCSKKGPIVRKRNRAKRCENIIFAFLSFEGLAFLADVSVLILKDVLEVLITHFPADIETIRLFFFFFLGGGLG